MDLVIDKNSTVNRQTPGNLIYAGYSIDAYAVLNVSGSVTIEASNDNFATTVYSNTVSADVLVQIAALNAKAWRVVGNGFLFIGSFLSVKNPSWPYRFENEVIADDRITQGGVGYSKIKFNARRGLMNFTSVQTTELASWRGWYTDTDGFRKGFVVRDPVDSNLVFARAPGDFPLQFQRLNDYSGTMLLQEIV